MDCKDSDSLYYIFGQVVRFHYYRLHTVLEKVGIYPGQHPLLFTLGKYDGLSQKELADKLNIQAATMTVMLRRMEKAKLIERRQDAEDQRVSRVFLTGHGRKVHDEVKELMQDIKAECFSNFTMEEQLLLRRLLMQMRDNLAKACGKDCGH